MKLFIFPRPVGLPNYSPFCVKLETYLRMTGCDYQPVLGFDSKPNSKRQMPFVEIDGKIIGDSTLIIDELVKRNGDKTDGNLTSQEQSIRQAFQTMLENHFTKFMVWFRWCDDAGWPVFRDSVFAQAPFFVRQFIAPLIARKVRKSLYSEGTGRLSPAEMTLLANKDLSSLSTYLGDKPFFFGAEPTLIDAIIFATVGNVILSSVDPVLGNLARKYENLVAHTTKMQQKYFSDIK